MKPYLVGISGGSGSGKTTFLNALRNSLPEGCISVVSQDNYYLPRNQQPTDEFGRINFDLPTSIDREAFVADMELLMQGKILERVEYTFNNNAVEPGLVKILPAPIVVMEGLFVFFYEEILNKLDLKVYIDVQDEIKLQRRISRDAKERGYPEDSVRFQWENHVMPSYKKFLYPFKKQVDIVIPNNKDFELGLEVLTNHLKTKL